MTDLVPSGTLSHSDTPNPNLKACDSPDGHWFNDDGQPKGQVRECLICGQREKVRTTTYTPDYVGIRFNADFRDIAEKEIT